jgi:hypothetical protein
MGSRIIIGLILYVIPNRSPSAQLRINSAEVRNLISREECILGNEIPRRMAPRNDIVGPDGSQPGLLLKGRPAGSPLYCAG